MEKLGRALQPDGDQTSPQERNPANALANLVSRDEKTGEQYLKLPVLGENTIQKIADLLGSLLGTGSK